MIKLIEELTSLRGISGDEETVKKYIKEKAFEYSDKIIEQKNGNLLIFRKGKKSLEKPLMLSAHMDEVGFIVKSIDESGFISFDSVGGIDARILPGSKVRIGENAVLGVIGKKAIHLLSEEEYKRPVEQKSLYIDIGASDKAAAEKLVDIGASVTFDSNFVNFGDGYIKARALDDRVGCAILLELLKEQPEFDTWFAFTTMEEIGCVGAVSAAKFINPKIAIIAEATTAADFIADESEKLTCKIGCGVVIPFMDKGTITNNELYKLVTNIADKNNIKWQTKTLVAGGTEASVIQRTLEGVTTVTISAPCRNIHSQSCVLKLSDVMAQLELIKLLLKNYNL